MNRSRSEEFFHIEMTSRMDTALDQLNHVIDTTILKNHQLVLGLEAANPYD